MAQTGPIEVRRNGWLLAGIGGAAALVAVAYLSRAVGSGAALDWVLAAVLGLVGAGYLVAFVDSRTPLLVADDHGVRLRSQRTWVGLPWAAITRIEHLPAAGWLRDGRLGFIAAQGAEGRRLGVRLGLATRVFGAPQGLDQALQSLVPGALVPGLLGLDDDAPLDVAPEPAPPAPDHEDTVGAAPVDQAPAEEPGNPKPGSPEPGSPEPGSPEPGNRSAGLQPPRWRDPRPLVAHKIGVLAARLRPETSALPTTAAFTDGALALDAAQPDLDTQALPELAELRRPDFDELPEATPEVAPEPVIGPQVRQARERLGLSVEVLSERTRIRPHVIHAVEVDDFAACGGDFYARGHLRTLARVLGIEAAPLLADYDEHYAHAPVSPRRVFETELVSGPRERAPRGGLNWSVLLAAVMAVVLAWSLARLLLDGQVASQQPPRLDGSGGVHGAPSVAGNAVPVEVRAAGGGAHVVVRDGRGRVVFTGDLAYGASRSLQVAPPIAIDSSDGSVEVVIDGDDRGSLGKTGERATGTFVPR